MNIMYKHKLFACPYIKPIKSINSITVTQEDEPARVSFVMTKEQYISPNNRELICIEANPSEVHKLSNQKDSVELVPSSCNNLPDNIKVIPCLNFLSPTFHTKIMVENCGNTKHKFVKGDPICCSWKSSYEQINEDPEAITNMWIGSANEDEINTVELEEDQEKHKASIQSDAAVLHPGPIPEELDITKHEPKLLKTELLDKFKLDHLNKTTRRKVEALILKYRPIWSEHPFDLGLHRYVKHNIVLTGELPPCPKQRFWPANRREAAEQLVDNLQKYHIVSKTITDWATNVVLIKKQSPRLRRQWSICYWIRCWTRRRSLHQPHLNIVCVRILDLPIQSQNPM